MHTAYMQTSPWNVSALRADEPSLKEYVYQSSVSEAWTVCFWSGKREVRYLHGFCCQEEALEAAEKFKTAPPDFQHGFSTVMELPE